MDDKKLNCWDVLDCGCEPGGVNADDRGVCPAAVERSLDGSNDGRNAGRSCWVVHNTLCRGSVQGHFGSKTEECTECEFYHSVRSEEGAAFTFTATLLARLDGGAVSDEVLDSDEELTAQDLLARIRQA
jgi:hypothetical protein